MGLLWWVLAGLGLLVVLFLVQVFYLSFVLAWGEQKTRGLGYFGLPPEGRAEFKRSLRRHAAFLRPILELTSRFSTITLAKASFHHDGITGPSGTCSKESFAGGAAYTPRPEDVFVATQMKCGTTWMQHVVYEVLLRGNGNLVDSGTALYAVSPWLEGLKSVPVADAVPIGTERPSRIIKTHFPARLCPAGPEARYIYVARHPVSCFASCVDFVTTNLGRMAPPLSAFEEWYRSDQMWWGTWPDHVKGWWARARGNPYVLFVHFEDMKQDLPDIVRQVAAFLGLAPLSDAEMGRVVEKCGFRYMQTHQDTFEMHPPHLLQTNAELFVRGTADRHKDVPAEVRDRIRSWCADAMRDSDTPLDRMYPDVRGAATAPAVPSGS